MSVFFFFFSYLLLCSFAYFLSKCAFFMLHNIAHLSFLLFPYPYTFFDPIYIWKEALLPMVQTSNLTLSFSTESSIEEELKRESTADVITILVRNFCFSLLNVKT